MIYIVDYGMGNLGSVQNMLKHIGIPSQIVDDPCVLEKANKILLPGVGSFDQAMKHIQQKGFLRILNQKALTEKIPVLGICLGMQLLTNGSEEGILPGLGWIDAKTIRFPINNGLKVPHMGWNIVHTSFPNLLTKKLPEESRFYFVHSYYVKVVNEENSILKTDYGVRFDAAIQKNNIYGVQFHPEKSHKFGMQILKNFAEI
ncbi:MAG: imidazole glycerol phosphate synthase subunit HisH [Bacteroidales bacterium]|nr:imidazole glycerol phosphate synthase subunit HisH [Acholeplasmataceae bacterium]MCK9448807.1 imidazole glycerol phosphate synthase subunit HisH [Bacteroidales bacterium]